MQIYKHKKSNMIIAAEKYRKTLEDGFYLNKPYINTTINNKLERVYITEDDYIIKYLKNNRIYTGLYPTKEFKKRFIRII